MPQNEEKGGVLDFLFGRKVLKKAEPPKPAAPKYEPVPNYVQEQIKRSAPPAKVTAKEPAIQELASPTRPRKK